ncbi:hypothetical protein GIW70_25575 [Pseudomonas syringae]|nr:hypothetical protein [Pseudomonas syringae]
MAGLWFIEIKVSAQSTANGGEHLSGRAIALFDQYKLMGCTKSLELPIGDGAAHCPVMLLCIGGSKVNSDPGAKKTNTSPRKIKNTKFKYFLFVIY